MLRPTCFSGRKGSKNLREGFLHWTSTIPYLLISIPIPSGFLRVVDQPRTQGRSRGKWRSNSLGRYLQPWPLWGWMTMDAPGLCRGESYAHSPCKLADWWRLLARCSPIREEAWALGEHAKPAIPSPWNPTSCEQDDVSMREGDGSGTSGLCYLPAGSHRGSVYSATRHAAWEHGYGPDHGGQWGPRSALWLCVFMSPSCKLVFSIKVIF